jgi:predicted enzyme related to lactoylglutathione lyase
MRPLAASRSVPCIARPFTHAFKCDIGSKVDPILIGREIAMARLRHFAVVVSDLEKAAKFYESVFDLKRVGRDDLEFASGIYLSDGVVNLALLKYHDEKGSGLKNASTFVGAHHFGFQVDDLKEAQKRIEAAGGQFFFDLGNDAEKENFERKFKDPDGIIFDISRKGWAGTGR